MLLENLLTLPIGTHVVGQIEAVTNVPGTVEMLQDGSHFIRWADGYATISFGKVRDYDEYIAAHTHLEPRSCSQALCDHEAGRASQDDELIATLGGFVEDCLNSVDRIDEQIVEVSNV